MESSDSPLALKNSNLLFCPFPMFRFPLFCFSFYMFSFECEFIPLQNTGKINFASTLPCSSEYMFSKIWIAFMWFPLSQLFLCVHFSSEYSNAFSRQFSVMTGRRTWYWMGRGSIQNPKQGSALRSLESFRNRQSSLCWTMTSTKSIDEEIRTWTWRLEPKRRSQLEFHAWCDVSN